MRRTLPQGEPASLVATIVCAIVAAGLACATGCETRIATQPHTVVFAYTASWCGECKVDKPTLAVINESVQVQFVHCDNWTKQQFRRADVDGIPFYEVAEYRPRYRVLLRTHSVELVHKFLRDGKP
jgi:hypothetical protein